MITAVDLLRGIANLLGWANLDCPGITSYHDTDYAMQGQVTCDALDHYDLVDPRVEAGGLGFAADLLQPGLLKRVP